MNRTRIWLTATALIAVIASAAGLALAHISSGDAEVRIVAQRLENGRTEFALQQRIDGEWGERILPRARFLPPNPSPGWKNASPLTIQTEPNAEQAAAAASALEAAKAEAAEAKQSLEEAQARLAELEAPIHREVGNMSFDSDRIRTAVVVSRASIRSTLTIQADGEYGLTDLPLETCA